jgi:hypothetical protein
MKSYDYAIVAGLVIVTVLTIVCGNVDGRCVQEVESDKRRRTTTTPCKSVVKLNLCKPKVCNKTGHVLVLVIQSEHVIFSYGLIWARSL